MSQELFLFGLLLGYRRISDEGLIWGCIGLHGGLVGLWFIVSSGFVQLSKNTPDIFIGGGEQNPNPMGGLVVIILLIIILLIFY